MLPVAAGQVSASPKLTAIPNIPKLHRRRPPRRWKMYRGCDTLYSHCEGPMFVKVENVAGVCNTLRLRRALATGAPSGRSKKRRKQSNKTTGTKILKKTGEKNTINPHTKNQCQGWLRPAFPRCPAAVLDTATRRRRDIANNPCPRWLSFGGGLIGRLSSFPLHPTGHPTSQIHETCLIPWETVGQQVGQTQRIRRLLLSVLRPWF